MSRIPVQTLDSAPEQTRATLQKLARRSGTLLNIHAEMASTPVVLAAYAGLREAAGNVGHVSDQAWNTARAAGWNEQELGEAFAHLAGNLFTNFFNHHARTDLDVPPPRSFAEHRMTHRARRRGRASASQRHITAGSNPGCCRVSSP